MTAIYLINSVLIFSHATEKQLYYIMIYYLVNICFLEMRKMSAMSMSKNLKTETSHP